jgi:DNA polymerase-1
MELIFDLEGDGLYEQITRIHCIVTKDIRKGTVLSWHNDPRLPRDGTVDEGLGYMSKATRLIGHNILGYDLPVLRKLCAWEYKGPVTDTLILSRLFQPDREGFHGLEAWGKRLGRPKPVIEDWSTFSSGMLHRCTEDVENNHLVLKALRAEVRGQDWGESIELEHDVARAMAQQEVNGVGFDSLAAQRGISHLSALIENADIILEPFASYELKPVGSVIAKPFKMNGDHSVRTLRCLGDRVAQHVMGPFQMIKTQRTSFGSDKQVKALFMSMGWVPEAWGKSPKTGLTTGPKLKDSKYVGLPYGLGEAYSTRVIRRHRMTQIQGWLDNVREDGRITASANTIGTPTGRMRHSRVVNVPSACTYPKFLHDGVAPHPMAGQLWYYSRDADSGEYPGNLYGTEMRGLFCAAEGYDFVGHDASGLELRMLAHYINDPTYTEILLNGDIHSHNQELAGLPTRSAAKTFIYAFIYGAGDAKLGDIIKGTEIDGAAMRAKFLSANPQLAKLISGVKRKAKKYGYLRGLDGRRIMMRRNSNGGVMEHKALNTLLQCAGAVVMKRSLVILTNAANDEGLDFRKVIDMHDEGQAEVACKDSKRYAELAELSLVQTGTYYKMRVPLAAEAKIGRNWAETH